MGIGAGKWYESLCEKHGRQEDKAKWKHKTIAVGKPKNRTQRKEGGCDMCRAEAKAAKFASGKV